MDQARFPLARRAAIGRMAVASAVTALPFLATPARAHTDKPHAPKTGPVRKEQKDWGIAGDAKRAKRSIEVGMADNMRFTPDRIQVQVGETVKFIVRNSGAVMHEFVIGTKAAWQDGRDRLDVQPARHIRVRLPDCGPLPGWHGGHDHGHVGRQGMRRRRAWMSLLSAGGLLAAPSLLRAQAQGQTVLVEVWKSPTCGCCQDWITHIEAHGFRAKAWVGGYAIEGHVPAADIRRLLKVRPDAIGLAVPGMPLGSPGMDGAAYDNRQDPYDVLLIARDGSTSVFNSYFKLKERS